MIPQNANGGLFAIFAPPRAGEVDAHVLTQHGDVGIADGGKAEFIGRLPSAC